MINQSDLRKKPRCRERLRQVQAVGDRVGGGTPPRLPSIRSRSPVRLGEIVEKAIALGGIWKAAHGQLCQEVSSVFMSSGWIRSRRMCVVIYVHITYQL